MVHYMFTIEFNIPFDMIRLYSLGLSLIVLFRDTFAIASGITRASHVRAREQKEKRMIEGRKKQHSNTHTMEKMGKCKNYIENFNQN